MCCVFQFKSAGFPAAPSPSRPHICEFVASFENVITSESVCTDFMFFPEASDCYRDTSFDMGLYSSKQAIVPCAVRSVVAI